MALSLPLYCDNAATSFPKPSSVHESMIRGVTQLGTAAGRGVYSRAQEVDHSIQQTRLSLARLFHTEPAQIIFTQNATGALNQVLHGLLRPGDHVVTSEVEHNSILRPLRWLQENRGVSVTVVSADNHGVIDPAGMMAAVTPKTRLIAMLHASNVSGAIQPIEVLAEFTRNRGLRFLVDAAQTAGYLTIDLSQLPIDYLACAGHKGLLGPLGTGVLAIRKGLETELEPLMQGGTGSYSEDPHQPSTLPDRFESGNLNVPGILGLGAGVEFLVQSDFTAERLRLEGLTSQFIRGMQEIPRIRIYGPPADSERVSVISMNLKGVDPQTLAMILDQSFRIEVRSGLHCAPGAHRACGSLAEGGTVRFSFGHFSTFEEVEYILESLRQIAGQL